VQLTSSGRCRADRDSDYIARGPPLCEGPLTRYVLTVAVGTALKETLNEVRKCAYCYFSLRSWQTMLWRAHRIAVIHGCQPSPPVRNVETDGDSASHTWIWLSKTLRYEDAVRSAVQYSDLSQPHSTPLRSVSRLTWD